MEYGDVMKVHLLSYTKDAERLCAAAGRSCYSKKAASKLLEEVDPERAGNMISEITGMEGDIIQLQEIFKYVRTSTASDGTVHGHFTATGVRPRFLADLTAKGIKIPGHYFDPSKPLE